MLVEEADQRPFLGRVRVRRCLGVIALREPDRLPFVEIARDDDRVDFGAGLLLRRTFARFAPLVRLTHTRSRSNIALYEFSRTRLDFGVTREF